RWPHADHRKGWARLAGVPAGTEDPGRQYAPGLLAGAARDARGLFLAPPPHPTGQIIYLTYVEPGDYGGGLALARAKLNATATSARLENFEVLWRQMPKGRGGEGGGGGRFSPG